MPSTASSTAEMVRTVALRGALPSSAISPKCSPGPRVARTRAGLVVDHLDAALPNEVRAVAQLPLPEDRPTGRSGARSEQPVGVAVLDENRRADQADGDRPPAAAPPSRTGRPCRRRCASTNSRHSPSADGGQAQGGHDEAPHGGRTETVGDRLGAHRPPPRRSALTRWPSSWHSMHETRSSTARGHRRRRCATVRPATRRLGVALEAVGVAVGLPHLDRLARTRRRSTSAPVTRHGSSP